MGHGFGGGEYVFLTRERSTGGCKGAGHRANSGGVSGRVLGTQDVQSSIQALTIWGLKLLEGKTCYCDENPISNWYIYTALSNSRYSTPARKWMCAAILLALIIHLVGSSQYR